jgi:dihydroorotase
MRILIKQAMPANRPLASGFGLKCDLLIENGTIAEMGDLAEAVADCTIAHHNLHVSPGFMDPFAQFNDPGFEQKETLETGAAAAAAGGYTRALALPNTLPALHNKAQISYVVQKGRGLPVQILPLGAISKQCEGKDLAEMYDMRAAGAVAFTDGTRPVQSSQLMLKALQYVKAFDGVVVQQPIDDHLSKLGLVHEGVVSTQMGLPGKPELAELLMIHRDIELLRYTGSRLHITGVSTAAGIDMIRKAKADGLQLTCSVTPYHLHFTVNDLHNYNTNLKLNPPLRTAADVEALKLALVDGTVDCLASHHQPHEYDAKVCEFEYAHYGMAGLETCYAAVQTAVPTLDGPAVSKLFSENVARIFNLSVPPLAVGQPAELTLYVPDAEWVVGPQHLKSLNKNNAFIGKRLQGKIVGTVNHQFFNTINY